MARFHLQYFGDVCLTVDGQAIRNFGTVRASKLLVLLSLSRSGRMPRGQLAEQLWPDDFFDSTRLRLRQEIHRLKRALESHSELVGSDQADVWIDRANITTDLNLLERALMGNTGPNADHCFEGAFLPGWDDPWVMGERSRAKRIQVEAAIAYGSRLLENGDAARALALSQKVISDHPLNEELRMVAVKAHSNLGSVAAAVAEYQDLRRQTRDKLGIDPANYNENIVAELAATAVTAVTRPLNDWSRTIPIPLDPMFGREELVNTVKSKLGIPAIRLVTLVGPGGIGKTRLAIEVARELSELGQSRVAFASLADVVDRNEWPRTILAQLREEVPVEAVPLKYLARLLTETGTVLVLDNFETVLPEASEAVQFLLQEVPGLRILITSTAPLKLVAETLVPVGPLDPATSGRELLVSALQSMRPQMLSLPGVSDELLQISARLDGYPLALKLAAARLRLLSPEALLEQLEISLPAHGRSDLPTRHHSLEAALASSFSTLTEAQLLALERIAPFPGGLSMDMAAIAFEGEPYLDLIESLLDSALVNLEDRGGPLRVRLLAPIRQYIESKIEGGQRSELEGRAVMCIWKFLEGFDLAPWKPLNLGSLPALDPESENLSFAWKWSCQNSPPLAFASAARFTRYEMARGRARSLLSQFDKLSASWGTESAEVIALLELVHAYLAIACHHEDQALAPLRRANETSVSSLKAPIALAQATIAFRRDFDTATDVATKALDVAELSGDGYLAARIHRLLGVISEFRGDHDLTQKHLALGHRGLVAADSGTESALAGLHLAVHLWYQGQRDETPVIVERSREILEQTREPAALAYLNELEGRMALDSGCPAEAEEFFRESLRIWHTVGSPFQEADQHHSITKSLVDQNRWTEAQQTLVSAATLWYEDNNKGGLCCSLALAALILQNQGNIEEAKRVLAFSLDFEREHNLTLVPWELGFRAQLLTSLGGTSPHELPLTLEAGLSLFDSLR